LEILIGSDDTLSNEKTALAIRRVVHTELEACATAINQSEKKAALDQLSEAASKLKRAASELLRQFG
jgi:ribosomal protein S20